MIKEKAFSKQLDISVTTVADIIKNVYITVASLLGRGHKRKIDPRLNKRIVLMV